MGPQIDIIDPLNQPASTNVLDVNGKFYISASGQLRHGGIIFCTKAWAKVYGTALPSTDPTQNSPYHPDPTAIEGYVVPNQRDFYFFGSQKTGEPSKTSRLIEVADPAVSTKQHLYIWGLASDGNYAEPDHIEMNLAVTHHTNAGDTVL